MGDAKQRVRRGLASYIQDSGESLGVVALACVNGRQEIDMTRNERGRGLSLVSAFVILSTLWFAALHASQRGANEEFILFSTDRDSTVRDDPSSEEIWFQRLSQLGQVVSNALKETP